MPCDEHLLDTLQRENARLQQQVAELETRLYAMTEECARLFSATEQAHTLPNKQTYLQMVVDHMPILLYAFDKNGIFTLSEGKGLERLGLQPGQVVGMSIFDLYSEQPHILAVLQRSLAGETFSMLVDGYTVEGQTAVFEALYTPIYDEHGQVGEVIGVAFDVTDRQRMQQELARTNEWLEALVDQRTAELRESQALLQESQRTAQIGGWQLDPRTAQLRWTEEMYRLYELPPHTELSLELAIAAYHSPARETLEQAHHRLLNEGTPYALELPFVTAAGKQRWIQARARPIYQDGQIVSVFGTLQDISERKEAENTYHTLVEHLQQGLTIFQEQCFVFANPAMEQILGYSREELLSFRPDESPQLIHPDDRTLVLRHIAQRLAGEAVPPNYAISLIHKDGSIRRVEVFASLISYQGKPAIQIAYLDMTERKQAEEALRESENKFRAVWENAGDAMALSSPEGIVLDANPAYCRLYGYTAEEVIGHEFSLIFAEKQRTWAMEIYRSIFAAPASDEALETEVTRADGTRRIVETHVSFLTRGTERVAMLSMIRDITERKQAEEALRASEARLKAIFDNAAVGIGLTDNAGKSMAINARGAQQLGYTSEELARLSNLELTHPDDQAATVELVQQLLRGEIPGYRIEKRYFRKDGSIFWADLSVSAVHDDDGQIAYLLGIVVDITERKQAEETLHQYRRIVSVTPDAVSLLNRHYVYQIVNDVYLHLNRKTYAEIVGHSVADLLGVEVFETVAKPYLDRCLAGETVHFSSWFTYAGAGQRFMDVTYTPYRDDQGNISGILVNTRDTTERRQAEEEIQALNRSLEQRNEELQDLNRELETFSYAIAHHLRSPLWTARLCAEALREDNADQMDRNSLELLQTIESTIERMDQTIERLLNMAALTREHMAHEPVNLSAIARAIADELCHREPARQVMFTIEPDMVVVGDGRLLHMLLENLLENAWKYTGKRAAAEISFRLQMQPDNAAQVYVVRDNGSGFDQARAADSFRAFQRLHANSDFPGTGIGLAMVRRIVHLHGGHIWAEAARDQGAAFFFTLG